MNTFEPSHDKTSKMACAPGGDSDQPGHPLSLIRVFTVRVKTAWVLSHPSSEQRRLWSDCADALADLSLRWVHCHFVGFVMRRLISILAAILRGRPDQLPEDRKGIIMAEICKQGYTKSFLLWYIFVVSYTREEVRTNGPCGCFKLVLWSNFD